MDGSPYLDLPLRTEAQAIADRSVIADRAALYERMLGYDEARADYVARCPWHQRRGHYCGYMNEQPSWAPLPHNQHEIAAATLHPEASADFWDEAANTLTDWDSILADLVDSAPTQAARELAEYDRRQLAERIKRARDFAKVLRAQREARR